MQTHTPGPWKVGTREGENLPILDREGNNLALADFADVANNADRVEANARLIAAAPDLLATLITIADFAVGHGDVCEIIAQRARAALAKAIP
jgi:hypothetical protein